MATQTPPSAQNRNSLLLPGILTIILLIIAVVAILALRSADDDSATSPDDQSAEVGFARDMIVHHNQAVEMSIILYDRTDNPHLRAIALDMMLTQQTQIGQMQVWLALWGVPHAGIDPPMTWMGMPVESGLMPGMATDEQLNALRQATGAEADRLFIMLMIPHHQAGIQMAEAVIDASDLAAVDALAQSMATAQQREIDALYLIAEEFEIELDTPIATDDQDSTSDH